MAKATAKKKSVLLCRFPYGACEHPDSVTWLMNQALWLERNGYEVFSYAFDDTPITMTRNKAAHLVMEKNIDYLLMLDSDMAPDYLVGGDPTAKPFLPTALEFLQSYGKPAAIAAPYCGKPPVENIFVFHWTNNESENPNQDLALSQYSREHAAMMTGVQRCAALPTGVFLISREAIEKMPKGRPMFYYEWKTPGQCDKASTEDVTFSRDLAHAGVEIFCAWDSWAGHWKMKRVGKPIPYSQELVEEKLHEAVRSRRGFHDRLVEIKDGEVVDGRRKRGLPRSKKA